MKKRVLMSATLAGMLMLVGCGGNSSNPAPVTNPDPVPVVQDVSTIKIVADNGDVTNVDPISGGTVVISRDTVTNEPIVATVVHSELNECKDTTSATGIACGPKEGITYIFQSDFGALGPVDELSSTPDGGVLLFDALTEYDGVKYNTPIESNLGANRIHEVYIPSNYIVLGEDSKNLSVNGKYDLMRTYLANACNMKCLSSEPENNPYFKDGKTEGTFVATYVMHFTKGLGEKYLNDEFKKAGKITELLEYLTVSFELKVEQVGGNSNKLKFTSLPNTPVVFGAKKAGGNAIQVDTKNINLNSILHESVSDSDDSLTINMARYFDKLIAKGDSIGVGDFAKEILVENALNPWPVKIYGTLHEINDDGTYQRSFVRNPAELNASLFNLGEAGSYQGAFDLVNGNTNQSTKFNIVYPGGKYNKL